VRDASSNTDALAIFYTTQLTLDEESLEQLKQIRASVIQATGLNPTYLLPLEKQALPKTETGKIRRARLRELFEGGAFNALLDYWAHLQSGQPKALERRGSETWTAVEAQLIPLWQQVLSVSDITPGDNFFELGGHSLALMQLLSRIRETFKVAFTPRVIFDFPTITALASQIEAYHETEPEKPVPQLLPVSRAKRLPLSFTQRRLWFLEQLRPGDTAYTSCSALKLTGLLSITALEQSLREIVRRHESLRTTFVEQDEQPDLLISSDMEVPFPLIELDHLVVEEQEQAACALIQQEIERPFELARGPLVRFMLLRLRPDEHVLVTVISHIISDGWSLGIFNQELAKLYDAFKQGEPSPLADLPLQFADYAFWQHQWLQGERLQQELAYWKEHLQGAPTLLELPTDHPRQPVQAGRVAFYHFRLSEQLAQDLNALCQQEQVTLFMLLLAAFKVLLYRYTGQSDIVVGTVIANRTHKHLEELIGFFANTLALRTTLADSLTFLEVLSKVREGTIGAYAHPEAPFEQVVNSLRIEQNLSHAPLVQVAFFLQNEQMYRPHFSDLQVHPFPFIPFPFKSGVARFDLLLEMIETTRGVYGSFEYDSELFERETIARLTGHWQTLLESVVAHPRLPLSRLPLLTGNERQSLLFDWNATSRPLPELKCLHHLFEEQVERTPHALAVAFSLPFGSPCPPTMPANNASRFEEQRLTYQELNCRANKLAHYLQAAGVGPEVLVGIYIERSLEMMIALLGVLKAGGAYVPLDPKLPQERLSFQLHDAQIALLLTQEHLLVKLSALPIPVVSLDTQWQDIAQQPEANPTSGVLPTHLAYMIYTSGSTGRPKGVQVLHQGVLNFLLSMQQEPGLQAHDILLAITTISFDIAALELFLPLLVGGQVVIASQEVAADSIRLASLLATSRATVMQATPSLWRLLLEGGGTGLPHLKALCGGEALPRELASDLLARTQALWNLYGPTETTIWSTIAHVEGGDDPVTIGHPIANTQIYILDQHLQPVPAGVVGELYIGGSGLARGYFQRPELTAERFVPNPFCREPGQRLYLTGDLARYRTDGSIEYLGRNDFQVKVHGYRIELGEIEAALRQHPAVQACVVTAVTGGTGNKQLGAYLIPRSGQTPGVEDLRRFLQSMLPEYMIPAFFISLAEFPLTPNGKIDRQALPVPDENRPTLTQTYVAPQTAEEEMLAAIWSNVLHIKDIGIHDNFFALGGDSLLSMSVLSKARRQGLDFSLQEFFQYPRIHDLARILRRTYVHPPTEDDEHKAVRESASVDLALGEVPLTAEQSWQVYTLRNPHQFNFPLLFAVHQPLHIGALEQTIHYLVRHHEALRLRCRKEGATWKQFLVHPDQEEIIPIEHIDLSQLSEDERWEAFRKRSTQAQSSLHLCNGPVSRVLYFAMGEGRTGRLLWLLNHYVCDRVTYAILAEDFLNVYQQFVEGELVSAPQKTTSFKHWAECIHEYFNPAALQEEMEHYWLKLPWDEVKPLPADFPEAAAIDSFKAGRQIRVTLSTEETRLLFREVLSADIQVLDVFLTVLSETFAHWTGSPYLPLYVSDHGREPLSADIDLIRTAGFLSWKRLCFLQWQEATPQQALQAIKKQIEAIPHKGKGFELLYYGSEHGERLQRLPVGEVLFNYVGQGSYNLPPSPLLSIADEMIDGGIDINDRREPPSCIQVVGALADDCLQLVWDYSENLYRQSTIEKLAQDSREILGKLIYALARNRTM
ncbi:MAG TPA: amino acid adenylation domain-containing protein, partial [Ktedonosporobacter sp.]|nr:amino acid adenylation domain-containing protein [Ktedonosporobacter sp.]